MKSQATDTLHKRGIVVYNSSFYKNFAVLMQDTTLSGNRFDYRFSLETNGNYDYTSHVNYTFPAFIIDSVILVKTEKKLLQPDSTISLYNYSKDSLGKNLHEYIRLYIGYIDTAKQLNVVVQFVTPKEYKENEKIYSRELWLLAQQRNLRFGIIKF